VSGPRLSDEESAALSHYVRWVADAMELRDWTIHISNEPCEEHAQATIEPIYARKSACIRFGRDFRELDPLEQRHTVVHELVHCHLESAKDMVFKDLEEHLGKPCDQIFYHGWNRQFEYGVDGIATALAKHMPLIDWPKPAE
jgi:hypothetical protein